MWIGHHKEIRKLTFRRRSESNELLTLEPSALESLYGGQSTLLTRQLIKPNYLVIFPNDQDHSFFRNVPPLNLRTSSY